MCRAATCSTCGKTTWAGCGMHVDQVMAGVPAAQGSGLPSRPVTSIAQARRRRRVMSSLWEGRGRADRVNPPPALGSSSRHAAAVLGAGAAGSDAILHAVQLLARRRARAANLGADAAYQPVLVGAARHEVERGGAYLGAVEHDLDVVGLGVLAANSKAMLRHHRQAGDVALVAGVHASLHFGAHLVVHRSSPLSPRP